MSTAKNLSTVPTRKKVSVKNVKLSDMDVGFNFKGIYRGQALGAPFQKVTPKGEVITSQITSVIMEDMESKERTAYVADKGLTEGLTNALVKEGDAIEVVKLEKINISRGREMNQYDIYTLG